MPDHLPKVLGPLRTQMTERDVVTVVAAGSDADILLFLDARSRPLAGLLKAHRELQAPACRGNRATIRPRTSVSTGYAFEQVEGDRD
jgi:hypothetical protein